MKKKISIFILSILVVASLGGCKKSETKADLGSNVDYQKVQNYPKWVIQPVYEKGIAGVGSSNISELGLDFARKEASASARADLAAQIEVKVNNLFKSYSSKIGAGEDTSVDTLSENVSKELVDLNLKGATLKDTWISPKNELFVFMTIDNERLKESTSEAVNNSKNYPNQDLEVKVKSKTAQAELEKELDVYFGPATHEDNPATQNSVDTKFEEPSNDKNTEEAK